jgi:AraC-like DNA-binding protein
MHAIYQSFPMLPTRQAQVWHHQPSFRRPRHFHAEPELNIVTRGSGVLAVGSQHLSITAGSAVLLQPGQDHELLAESPDFELFVLALRPELAQQCHALAPRRLCCIELDEATLGTLRSTLMAIGHIADASVVERLLGDSFDDLVPRFDAPQGLGRRVLLAMQTNLEASETEVADGLRAHPSDVSRAVRHALGMRLVDYRVHLRLMQFIQCVDAGQSLTHAAFASGFGSYAQCHRAFWRHVNTGPRAYFASERVEVDRLLHQSLGPASQNGDRK